jgi:hypothetical protein
MSEATGGINCPECGMSFDESDGLERHSRQQHTTEINKEKTLTSSLKETVQSRTEEKGKGETAESLESR